MTKPSIATRVRWSLKRDGVLGTVREVLLKQPRSIGDYIWDLWHDVETRRVVEVDDLAVENPSSATRYQGTPTRIFRKIVGGLAIPYRDFTFVDFGSGKGRVLLVAAEFPFKSAVGVEFSPHLHQQAQRNIRSYRGRLQCHDIRSICMDATKFQLPEGNCVLYFFYPFHVDLMRPIVRMIDAAAVQDPSIDILILMYRPHPTFVRLIETESVFTRAASSRDHVVYEPGARTRKVAGFD